MYDIALLVGVAFVILIFKICIDGAFERGREEESKVALRERLRLIPYVDETKIPNPSLAQHVARMKRSIEQTGYDPETGR